MSNDNEKETVGQAETVVSIPGPGPLNPIGTPRPPRVIDWSKPVRSTGSKRPVHIYAIDHRLKKPVIGYDPLFTSVIDWFYDGTFQSHEFSGMDLENVPEVPHV